MKKEDRQIYLATTRREPSPHASQNPSWPSRCRGLRGSHEGAAWPRVLQLIQQWSISAVLSDCNRLTQTFLTICWHMLPTIQASNCAEIWRQSNSSKNRFRLNVWLHLSFVPKTMGNTVFSYEIIVHLLTGVVKLSKLDETCQFVHSKTSDFIYPRLKFPTEISRLKNICKYYGDILADEPSCFYTHVDRWNQTSEHRSQICNETNPSYMKTRKTT